MMPKVSAARPIIPTERALIGRLREQLRAAEAATGLHSLGLGIPTIDGALGGGLAGGTLGLLLRPAPEDDSSSAATRWIVGAAASSRGNERWGVGPPRLAVRLARNRRGHLGTWIVEWDSVEQRFVLAAHSEPVVRA